MLHGLILKESLTDEHILDLVHITRPETWAIQNPAEHQPPVWTALTFELEDSQADAFCEQLSRSLRTPGWFVNAATDTQVYVIFPGRVFCYPKGDAVQRAAAKQFGLTLGIPERQLDWGE